MSSGSLQRHPGWWIGGLALVLGALALVRLDITSRRAAFEQDARAAHRLLSQRAAQHDAVLATLAALAPALPPAGLAQELARLLPQLIGLQVQPADALWPSDSLAAADARSRRSRRPELADVDEAALRYRLVLAAAQAGMALEVDVRRLVPWDEWPIEQAGPVRVALAIDGHALRLQPGDDEHERPFGITQGFVFSQRLASLSQPFELQLQRATGPSQWPWERLAAWALGCLLLGTAIDGAVQSRRERRQAETLQRLSRVARLNALGEMAAGVAHELNQPLTAVLANTQAARRLLEDDPADLDTARRAMAQASGQARRAADVVARLRRRVETPEVALALQPVRLSDVVARVLELVERDARRRGVQCTRSGDDAVVRADPVALEQIVHNLVGNALQALDEVPRGERRLVLRIERGDGRGVLAVRDSGPGVAPEAMARLFDPFYTTRAGGLGLGLALCATLAAGMDGRVAAQPALPRGAVFRVELPLAEGAPA